MLSEQERATAKRAIEALKTGDMETLVAEYDPDVEYVMTRTVDPANVRGVDAVRAVLRETADVVRGLAVEVDEIVEGDGRALYLAHFSALGGGDKAALREKWAWIWEFRDDKIARVEVYRDWGEAKDASGLAD